MNLLRLGKALYKFIKGSLLIIFCYKTIKLYLCNHLTIGIWRLYKQKTIFPHPIGIVIGLKVVIGKNCEVYQNVTIGTKDTKSFENGKYPKIGNNVIIYPNSIIIGDITIGDNVIIGAGSIVLNDVPGNSIVAGAPAKLLKAKIL